jgi:esterase/lipase superfamily enzyme
MIRTFLISVLSLIILFSTDAQSDIFKQDVQYNVLVESEDDSTIVTSYEVVFRDADGEVQFYTTPSQDSFLMIIKEDLSYQAKEKSGLLFHIHGMWGGRRFNFNQAYRLMHNAYINNDQSDIARIISLKWPGNKSKYKENKELLYTVSDSIAEVFFGFMDNLHSLQSETNKPDSGIDLIAHSLGTELFKEFVDYASRKNHLNPYFDQIVIAAPDWDVDVFKIDSTLYNIQYLADRTHVYYSHRDMTLSISKNLNKQSRFGLDGPGDKLELPKNVYAINVTEVRDEANMADLIAGHNYYRISPIVTADMLQTFRGDGMDEYKLRKQVEGFSNIYYIDAPQKKEKK